jgi:hypothetical protein
MEIIKTKCCSKCGVEKPADKIHFVVRKTLKSGIGSECKQCRNQHAKLNVDKEYKRQYAIEYRKTHSEYYKEKNKEFELKNKKERNKKRYEYKVRRLKNDSFFKLKNDISTLIRNRIKNKSKSTKDILGCSIEEFMIYIEKQFQSNMTWDNHTQFGWHLDHITPLSLAKTEEDLYRLNHYTNFQPLWWYDNLSKSNKLPEQWLND